MSRYFFTFTANFSISNIFCVDCLYANSSSLLRTKKTYLFHSHRRAFKFRYSIFFYMRFQRIKKLQQNFTHFSSYALLMSILAIIVIDFIFYVLVINALLIMLCITICNLWLLLTLSQIISTYGKNRERNKCQFITYGPCKIDQRRIVWLGPICSYFVNRSAEAIELFWSADNYR